MIKNLIGIFICGLAVIAALYVGIWVMFIGGIVQVVQSCAPEVVALGIAIGLARVFFASLVGWACWAILWSIGLAFLPNYYENKSWK